MSDTSSRFRTFHLSTPPRHHTEPRLYNTIISAFDMVSRSISFGLSRKRSGFGRWFSRNQRSHNTIWRVTNSNPFHVSPPRLTFQQRQESRLRIVVILYRLVNELHGQVVARQRHIQLVRQQDRQADRTVTGRHILVVLEARPEPQPPQRAQVALDLAQIHLDLPEKAARRA